MRIRPSVAVGVGLSTIALYSFSAAGTPATAAAGAPPTQVRATTSAEILHLAALDVPGLTTLAESSVGASTGSVRGASSPRTSADAANLGLALADQDLGAILATASQTAPSDHLRPATATSVEGEVPGLLALGVSDTSANARWTGAGSCPAPDAALTRSTVSTADVATEQVPEVGTLLSLDGTASTSQSTRLADTARPGIRSVVSSARGSTADVRLLDGQLRVAVTDAPTLTATASGRPGGAEVRWSAPAVTVSLAGQEQTLPVDGSPLDLTSPDNPLLHVELSLGQATDVVEKADGTTASASASVLHVTARLGTADLGATVLDTDLFPLQASATAPDGGVDCGVGSDDSDGDGLTDDEETSGSANDGYGNQPTKPRDADTDNDGLTDGQEASGAANDGFGGKPTDPTDADTDGDSIGDGAETSGAANDGYGNEATDPLARDTDGDRLTDGREITQTGTDPNNADTDGGTVSDGDEVTGGTDPNNPVDDATGSNAPTPDDPDGDGLDNGAESDHGTNPVDPDTDGDGLEDGREVTKTHTDPVVADTDGDRLDDGREVLTTHTNPRRKDTDGDKLTDGREVLTTHTNPRKKDTDGDKLTDGREVLRTDTNPRKKDTDRDGLGDGREVDRHAPSYARCHTDPNRSDSDRDGLRDGAEVTKYRTNPCDWDTDGGGISDGREARAGSDPLDPQSGPDDVRPTRSMALRW